MFKKSVRFILKLSGIFIIALLAVLSICNAINNNHDSAGWFQVAIELIGLPAILYGLYHLVQMKRKPDIEIGVNYGGLPLGALRTMALKTSYKCPLEDPAFELIIRNKGTAAARNVKLYFEYDASAVYPPIDDLTIEPQYGNPFQPLRRDPKSINLIYSDLDWYLPALDVVAFSFRLHREKSNSLSGHSYFFKCIMLADGLEKPVEQQIEIIV